jgi:hypothetical protein
MVAESRGERIMVPARRQRDQDPEGDLADTARDADLPPRMACDGMPELSLSPVLAVPSYDAKRRWLELLAELPGATGASNRRVQTVSLGVTAEGGNLILADWRYGR